MNKPESDELVRTKKELAFQIEEKGKCAAALVIANLEKGKRASELAIAIRELTFQITENEKRAGELIAANIEATFQNEEKEKRAEELIIANIELTFQNEEKEKRALELSAVNAQLETFSYVSSHDLQEPLRKIQTFALRILESESQNLSEKGQGYFLKIQNAAARMRLLIDDLLAFSRLNVGERKFENIDLNKVVNEVKNDLGDTLEEKQATIESGGLCEVNVIYFQFIQIMHNLISNALKFSKQGTPLCIIIKSAIAQGCELNEGKLVPEKKYCHISIADNGIGFEAEHSERIFEVFQRLHGRERYVGTGIGLAIVKKVIDNHGGIITATGILNEGATFNIYIPAA
jgi:light-regulated signal transduction histidine kinase (bacteriophytochrome)